MVDDKCRKRGRERKPVKKKIDRKILGRQHTGLSINFVVVMLVDLLQTRATIRIHIKEIS